MAGDFDDRLNSHEEMLRRLIQIAAHQDTISQDLRAMTARMDTRMTEQEERQEQHEAHMNLYMQRQDTINERLTAAIERIDQTLAQLHRHHEGRGPDERRL